MRDHDWGWVMPDPKIRPRNEKQAQEWNSAMAVLATYMAEQMKKDAPPRRKKGVKK